MMHTDILTQLEIFNDPKFKFEPKYHKYTYDGNQFISVTKFISRFHKEFDTEYWSKKKSEELDVDQEELKKEWKRLNDYANDIGHQTHNWIENYYNGINQNLPINLDVIDRINKFNVVYAKHLYKLDPVKFEVRVFSKKWRISGTIDSIFVRNGKLYILDWKTNKSFDDDSSKRYNKLLSPFDDYYENQHNEYSIQVSLYTLILEELGFEIGGAYLVHIGPNNDAQIHKAIDMRDILKQYLDTTWLEEFK